MLKLFKLDPESDLLDQLEIMRRGMRIVVSDLAKCLQLDPATVCSYVARFRGQDKVTIQDIINRETAFFVILRTMYDRTN